MPSARSLDGLVALPSLSTADERRAAFRQGMATLARAAADQEPAPLEGLSPDALKESVGVALRERLLDDLDWLSPSAAAVALYELAAALPMGTERRALGRRVVTHLHDSDAATFVALATALATGSRRGLAGAPIRARVALALDLPVGTGGRSDALALALVSRRELAREWLQLPSTGSLPSRRLAARLLERAAREAVLRAGQGDDGPLRLLQGDVLRAAFTRLLGDRESLVWRHVATARGLLSAAIPSFADEIERALSPRLTPTEWRRAAASLAASVAVAPDSASARARAFLTSDVAKKDPGVAGAMILGLPRAAETEPDAAERLLELGVRTGGLYAVESLVEVLGEREASSFGDVAIELARAYLRSDACRTSDDDGHLALVSALEQDLSPHEGRAGLSLRDRTALARGAFATEGAREAQRRAREVLGAAQASLATLERTKEDDTEGRRVAFTALRDLDVGLLETSTLHDLLLLGAGESEVDTVLAPLDEIHARLTNFLLERERDPVAPHAAVLHPTVRLRRLRALLHLVDAETVPTDSPARAAAVRERRMAAARVLFDRVANDAPSTLRRTVCAAVARAGDALVRDDVWELSDLLVAVMDRVHAMDDLVTLAEASMEPEIERVLESYSALLRLSASSRPGSPPRLDLCVAGLEALAWSLPSGRSPRTQALRGALGRFSGALEAILAAHSLESIADASGGTPLAGLESAADALARLISGAHRRLGGRPDRDEPRVGSAIRWLQHAIERALRGTAEAIPEMISATERALHEELPDAIAAVAQAVLGRLATLPAHGDAPIPLVTRAIGEPPLPPWLPPNRTMGGFYVVRSIGNGAVGTVFVARRSDERHDAHAERFALKVPRYDGDAARTLTEDQFDQIFRDEAGALLAIPRHPNLAKFVTFDAGAKPKPILVMELVEGPTLERIVEGGDLDVAGAFAMLDGVAAGLEVMHKAGVGHLDVKPSNVIYRDPDGRGPGGGRPVLVDFGLSGRSLRPGCATAPYGAPEIWGLVPEGLAPIPMPADVYAFGCLAYEILTRRKLFDAPNEIAMVTAHVGHDGAPPPLGAMAKDAALRPLVDLLAGTLRRDPRNRTSIAAARAALSRVAPKLAGRKWPLS